MGAGRCADGVYLGLEAIHREGGRSRRQGIGSRSGHGVSGRRAASGEGLRYRH